MEPATRLRALDQNRTWALPFSGQRPSHWATLARALEETFESLTRRRSEPITPPRASPLGSGPRTAAGSGHPVPWACRATLVDGQPAHPGVRGHPAPSWKPAQPPPSLLSPLYPCLGPPPSPVLPGDPGDETHPPGTWGLVSEPQTLAPPSRGREAGGLLQAWGRGVGGPLQAWGGGGRTTPSLGGGGGAGGLLPRDQVCPAG